MSAGHEPDLARRFLAEGAALVDAALDRWLPQPHPHAPRLAEAMRYSIFAGGKRLRPALAIAASRAAGGSDEAVLPFACAVEIVHTYSLIHDDLPAMDDDDLRRGRPTSHVAFGEALAILAGDALHTLAFDVLLEHTTNPVVARDLALALARAAGHEGMVGGQVDDMAAGGTLPDAERLQSIHRRKTGALIAASVAGGARAAGADEPTCEALDRYGDALGLAFQIGDDILDVTGTAASLGKTPGKDAQSGKLTYVALEGIDAARARLEACIRGAQEALAGLPQAHLLHALAAFVGGRSD